MAARRGRKKTRRRRDTRISLLSGIESVVYGSIITEAAFDTNLVNFVTGKGNDPGVQLTQLLSNPEWAFEKASSRLTNPNILVNAMVQSIMTGVLFKFANKALATPKRKVNAGLKQLGVPVKM